MSERGRWGKKRKRERERDEKRDSSNRRVETRARRTELKREGGTIWTRTESKRERRTGRDTERAREREGERARGFRLCLAVKRIRFAVKECFFVLLSFFSSCHVVLLQAPSISFLFQARSSRIRSSCGLRREDDGEDACAKRQSSL